MSEAEARAAPGDDVEMVQDAGAEATPARASGGNGDSAQDSATATAPGSEALASEQAVKAKDTDTEGAKASEGSFGEDPEPSPAAGATASTVGAPPPAAKPGTRQSTGSLSQQQQERTGSAAPPELRHLLLQAETGLVGDLAHTVGLTGTWRSTAAGDLGTGCLRFYSWWYEDIESADLTLRISTNQDVGGGLKRRYITVDYDISSQSFSLKSADDGHVLQMSNILGVTNKFGSNVEMWDLYVGATLMIMGKSVTLLKADIHTSSWIDHHTRRLNNLRKDLLEELQKYKPRAHSNSLTFDKGTKRDAGGQSLRLLVDQINALLDDLKQYRPAKAEQFRARIGIKA